MKYIKGQRVYYARVSYGLHTVVDVDTKRKEYALELEGEQFNAVPEDKIFPEILRKALLWWINLNDHQKLAISKQYYNGTKIAWDTTSNDDILRIYRFQFGIDLGHIKQD